jgi:hypothetical protein
MSISRLMQMAAAGAGGEYQISRSLRFNSADSAYLSRTPASASNRKTWTWSGWVKRSKINATSFIFTSRPSLGAAFFLYFDQGTGDNALRIAENGGGSSDLITTQLFRDVSAWYHIVVAWDTTQATASNRVKIYVNGVQVTSFATSTYPTLNADSEINNTSIHSIGSQQTYAAGNYFDGYMTEVNFIDGQALTPTSFGEFNATTGVWSPIAYAGSYGTNGFYLNFSDNSDVTAATLGKDDSGNGNNWTPSGFSVTAGAGNDSLVDSPTQYGTDTGAGGEVRGNYCTLNPLSGGGSADPTNGNLDQTVSGASLGADTGTFLLTTGKWYWEITSTLSTNDAAGIGILRANLPAITFFTTNPSGVYYYVNGDKYIDGTGSAYGATWNTLGTAFNIAVALDVDGGTVTFYKNGVSQGAITLPSNTNGWLAHSGFGSASGSTAANFNFGQRPFAYTAPSGFKALVTTNLPTPTVVQGDDYFNTVLFTGNYPTGQSITGVGFAPDLTWFKSRSVGDSHNLVDKVRGAFRLKSNTTDAETSATVTLDSDGFTVGAQSESNNDSMVAWNWKANGAGVSNTDGTITSTVSANTTAGISIVTYTGNNTLAQSVGHGLGAAPAMIIVKSRSNVTNWLVWQKTYNVDSVLLLNGTDALITGLTGLWGSANPTSTTFGLNRLDSDNNRSGQTYVAYCFAEVEGFSKFGSYTGNGSADGPFVYTGFRPAFVLGKDSSSTNNWFIFDSVRDTYNVAGKILRPNLSDAELDSPPRIDLLSNGFKVRSTALPNDSGETYIYAAFAENPFKYSLAR